MKIMVVSHGILDLGKQIEAGTMLLIMELLKVFFMELLNLTIILFPYPLPWFYSGGGFLV
jgi:hypothetical protein